MLTTRRCCLGADGVRMGRSLVMRVCMHARSVGQLSRALPAVCVCVCVFQGYEGRVGKLFHDALKRACLLVSPTCLSKSLLSASNCWIRDSISFLPCSVCSALRIPNATALSYRVCAAH